MKRNILLDLLADHADTLNRCDDVDTFNSQAWLSTRQPSENKQIILLLQLAQAIKRVLIPVPTPSPFRSELRQVLAEGPRDVRLAGKPSLRHLVLLGAAAVLGLSVIALRRVRPMIRAA